MGIAFVTLWVTGGIVYTAWRFIRREPAPKKGPIFVIASYFACLLIWGVLTSLIAVEGGYVATTGILTMNLGTLVPLVLTGCFLLIPPARRVFERWIASISVREFLWIHLIRLAAIGTIIKMLRGTLPAHFIIPVGVPDFIVALSVPVMVWLAFRKRVIGRKALISWNVIGFGLFLPALVLLHLSVPSPFRIFFDPPNTYEVFRFPMALVPSLLAPLFIIIHNAAIVKLLRPGLSEDSRQAPGAA